MKFSWGVKLIQLHPLFSWPFNLHWVSNCGYNPIGAQLGGWSRWGFEIPTSLGATLIQPISRIIRLAMKALFPRGVRLGGGLLISHENSFLKKILFVWQKGFLHSQHRHFGKQNHTSEHFNLEWRCICHWTWGNFPAILGNIRIRWFLDPSLFRPGARQDAVRWKP